MRRTAILEATRPPRRRLLLPGSRRQNVRPTRNGLGFMRKFGEYVFLKDSRYARQAKSARALPLGASARPGCGLASPLSGLGRNDERKGWLYSAASSGARFSAC